MRALDTGAGAIFKKLKKLKKILAIWGGRKFKPSGQNITILKV